MVECDLNSCLTSSLIDTEVSQHGAGQVFTLMPSQARKASHPFATARARFPVQVCQQQSWVRVWREGHLEPAIHSASHLCCEVFTLNPSQARKASRPFGNCASEIPSAGMPTPVSTHNPSLPVHPREKRVNQDAAGVLCACSRIARCRICSKASRRAKILT